MDAKKIEILKSYGFTRYTTDCELMYAFRNEAYGLDTKMLVQGAHADDYADLIYAEEEGFQGFCYCSSLMEDIMLNFSNHNVERIVKKLGTVANVWLELKAIGGYVMVVSKCDDFDFNNDYIRWHISDMLKAIGMLDYLLQQRLKYLMNKRRKKEKEELEKDPNKYNYVIKK